MGTTIALIVVGIVILGVTIFSFQFANGGSSVEQSSTDRNAADDQKK